MASILVLGSTGMVGSHFLSVLRHASTTQFSQIHAVARRNVPAGPESSIPVMEYIEKDTSKWSSIVSSITPTPSVMYSSLATTRAAAGGFEAQYKIEHDLNVELAKTAREAGVKTYVLISGNSPNSKSYFSFVKMKGEIEEHIKELGFDHMVILRPGLIGGNREESRPSEAAIRKIASFMGSISSSLTDFWVQDADVIARAAISATLKAERGEVKDKVWILEQSDIIRLGRTEWKGLK